MNVIQFSLSEGFSQWDIANEGKLNRYSKNNIKAEKFILKINLKIFGNKN